MQIHARSAMQLPARYYALLLDLLVSQGIKAGVVLRRAGVTEKQLRAPQAVLQLAQVERLIEAAVHASGRADIGFYLGRLIKPSSHEFLGYAMMTCACVDEALRLAARYWRLITPTFSMRHTRDEHGSVQVDLYPALPLGPASLRCHLEAIAMAFHEEIGFLLAGRVPSYDLYLPGDLALDRVAYRRLAHARVHFVTMPRQGLRIVLGTAIAESALALADGHALGIARQRCDEALLGLTRHGSLSDWVSMMVGEARDHQPRQTELANLLHISTRSMNRRLAAEGTTFRELGNRARHATACCLLDEGRLGIMPIALQLGYLDAANFSRAFGRMQGMSPKQYRARNRDASA